jgi:predicted thioredoxin/glutaredoxin
MATVERASAIPPEEMAEMEEVCRLISKGQRVTDPDLLRRIRERSEEVRREMFEKHGLTNIAVDLIREARDEE